MKSASRCGRSEVSSSSRASPPRPCGQPPWRDPISLLGKQGAGESGHGTGSHEDTVRTPKAAARPASICGQPEEVRASRTTPRSGSSVEEAAARRRHGAEDVRGAAQAHGVTAKRKPAPPPAQTPNIGRGISPKAAEHGVLARPQANRLGRVGGLKTIGKGNEQHAADRRTQNREQEHDAEHRDEEGSARVTAPVPSGPRG